MSFKDNSLNSTNDEDDINLLEKKCIPGNYIYIQIQQNLKLNFVKNFNLITTVNMDSNVNLHMEKMN